MTFPVWWVLLLKKFVSQDKRETDCLSLSPDTQSILELYTCHMNTLYALVIIGTSDIVHIRVKVGCTLECTSVG